MVKVKLPEKGFRVVKKNAIGLTIETGNKINAFIDLLSTLLTLIHPKSDHEINTLHSIRETIESVLKDPESDAPYTEEGLSEIEFDKNEVKFILDKIREIYNEGRLTGDRWYYLLEPLKQSLIESKEKD